MRRMPLLLALKVGEGAASRERGQLLEAKETASPQEPPEETQPCRHLDFRTSDLQNHKIVNLCCFV